MKNAGFACFGSPSELLADIDAEGEKAALQRVEERWLGLLELRKELGDGAIGFERTGGHEVFSADDPLYTRVAERFDRLNELLGPIICGDAYRWDDPLAVRYGMDASLHVARTDFESPLHPGLLMSALLRKVHEAGVVIRFGADVMAIDEEPAHATIRLHDGGALRASRVVVATNGYAAELLADVDIRPARGQVLLTSPVPGLKLKGAFHMNEGFYYFRDFEGSASANAAGRRVLLGGGRVWDIEGETTTKDGVTDRIQNALEDLLRTVILPGRSFSIERRWSGIMGFRAKGKTPLVDHVSPRVIAAVGLSGMGVAIGIRVARKAAALANE